jgi:hypothetical protein
MITLLFVMAAVLAAFEPAAPEQVRLERHVIAQYPAGYQATVADLNGDGRPDVLAVATEADRSDWFEAPGWTPHPLSGAAKPTDIAVRDIDGDGKPDVALAAGFYFSESERGGDIGWLERPAAGSEAWTWRQIDRDPVTHRIRWADFDGDGRSELAHAPIFGKGSSGQKDPRPAHLWAFRVPKDPRRDPWPVWKIDETLTILHGIFVADLDRDGRDEILAASAEGIHRFDWEGTGEAGRWRKLRIARGAEGTTPALSGASEVVAGTLSAKSGAPGRFIASIEPWHGTTVVVYTPTEAGDWRREVIDDTFVEGHALAAVDLDGDGDDEIVAGYRGAGGALAFYHRRPGADAGSGAWTKTEIERGIAVECVVATDLNGDRRPDLVAVAGRSKLLVWYENRGPAAAPAPGR